MSAINNPDSSSNSTDQTQEKTRSKQPEYTFDIPSLVGKDIDEIIQVMGKPAHDSEPTAPQLASGSITEWEKSYERDGQDLLVTYRLSDRKVVDFFISADDPSGATKDKKHLLEIGNLSENDPRYSVEFVKVINNPSAYTGVKVIPKQ